MGRTVGAKNKPLPWRAQGYAYCPRRKTMVVVQMEVHVRWRDLADKLATLALEADDGKAMLWDGCARATITSVSEDNEGSGRGRVRRGET